MTTMQVPDVMPGPAFDLDSETDDRMPGLAFGSAEDFDLDTESLVISQTGLAPDASHHGFAWQRVAPADWIRALRELSPPSDEIGWLELVWEPGDPWVLGQRWTLYEMLHEKFVDEEVLAELQGPNPRSAGHMCADKVPDQFQCLCQRKFNGWRGGPCQLVTLTEWHLYRRTGYIGHPFWVIQGTTGGHKFKFDEHEQELLRFEGVPSDAPPLGSLPYAPFDGRVVRQIQRHNRLIQLGNNIAAYRTAMGPGYEQYKARIARDMRANYVRHLATQMADVSDEFVRLARIGELDDSPRTEVDFAKVEEVATDHFIETGELLAPQQID